MIRRADPPKGVNSYKNDAWWQCRCLRCGKTCVKASTYLRSSPETHCGCMTQSNLRKARKMSEAVMANRTAAIKAGTYLTDKDFGYMPVETCPVCGKDFEVLSTDWVYKHNGKRVCSWHCQRDAEKADESRMDKRDEY